jgi:pyruvate formate lyase activating enzyme
LPSESNRSSARVGARSFASGVGVALNSALESVQTSVEPAARVRGLVFDIRHYSVHDGPGIRTTVFFKGCPLACWWCHNPEGRLPKPSLMFFEDRCVACGECAAVCPHGAVVLDEGGVHTNAEVCRACGTCADACPSGARELAGRWMSVPEVMQEIEKDRVFYDQSGGGVTLSGGEPLAQPHFFEALLEACAARGIHTVVETCGFARRELLLSLAPKVDLFLFDLKLFDAARHQTYVGVSNQAILANLEALARKAKGIVIRYPVIPGINDQAEEVAATGDFLAGLGLTRIDLLPYHQTGVSKYRRLAMDYRLPELKPPSTDDLHEVVQAFSRAGMTVRVGG